MSDTVSEPLSLRDSLRGPALAAGSVIIAFFGIFLGWASLVDLASAAMAPGVISPDGRRRTLQHEDGGSVREVLVREGDRVKAGDLLVLLDQTAASARLAQAEAQLLMLTAQRARLEAERSGQPVLTFPDSMGRTPEADQARRSQQDSFEATRKTQATKKQILEQQVAQLTQQIAGIERSVANQRRAGDLLRQEVEMVDTLVRKELAARLRLLERTRDLLRLEGDLSDTLSSLTGTREKLTQTRLEIVSLDQEFRRAAAQDLERVVQDLTTLEEEVRANRQVLARTSVRAPATGVVVDLRLRGIGSVVRPGDVILEIVPEDEPLLIEARLPVADVDRVTLGATAMVTLPAYRHRSLPQLRGQVRLISADALEDQRTGQKYYRVEIQLEQEQWRAVLADQGDLVLSAGMQADVSILSAERSLLGYLIEPLTQAFAKAFREA